MKRRLVFLLLAMGVSLVARAQIHLPRHQRFVEVRGGLPGGTRALRGGRGNSEGFYAGVTSGTFGKREGIWQGGGDFQRVQHPVAAAAGEGGERVDQVSLQGEWLPVLLRHRARVLYTHGLLGLQAGYRRVTLPDGNPGQQAPQPSGWLLGPRAGLQLEWNPTNRLALTAQGAAFFDVLSTGQRVQPRVGLGLRFTYPR
jgi:hypothetical protein